MERGTDVHLDDMLVPPYQSIGWTQHTIFRLQAVFPVGGGETFGLGHE